MSQENVELLKRGLEAFARGDIAAVLELLAPDVDITSDALGLSGGGSYLGHDGFVRATRETLEAFEDYRIDGEEFIDAGEDVVVLVHISGRGRGSGIPVDMRLVHVWTVRGGKGIRARTFENKEAALEALGLRE
jgi:ketosteroid isomerase-like protein